MFVGLHGVYNSNLGIFAMTNGTMRYGEGLNVSSSYALNI